MVALLTENLWIWILLAGMSVFAGSILYTQTGSLKAMLCFAGSAVVLLALGCFLVYGVPTDRKEIKRAIYELADAVERNDLPAVLALLDPSAKETIGEATRHLKMADIEVANVTNFRINGINRFTSPPTALASFNGTVRGTVSAAMMTSPFAVIVRFESVELSKSPDGRWRVTDNCRFSYPGRMVN